MDVCDSLDPVLVFGVTVLLFDTAALLTPGTEELLLVLLCDFSELKPPVFREPRILGALGLNLTGADLECSDFCEPPDLADSGWDLPLKFAAKPWRPANGLPAALVGDSFVPTWNEKIYIYMFINISILYTYMYSAPL